jgi:hypothetical protein
MAYETTNNTEALKVRKKNIDLSNVEKEITTLYENGETTTSLSKLYNVSDVRILYILRKYKIETRKNKIIDISTKNEIARLYEDGYTSTKLMEIFDISNKSVFNILEEMCVASRGIAGFSRDFKKYKFNIDFFNKITPELAYFYGFCLGDGSISIINKNSFVRFNLHKKDRVILENFVKWMSAPIDMIKELKNKNQVALRINHSIFKQDHSRWGLVPNKTYEPSIPIIDKEWLPYFIIGLIDADGHIKFNKKYVIKLVGNKKIMKWFIESIRFLGFEGHFNYYDDYSDVWSIVDISRKKDVIALAKILDVVNCDFLLSRKWNDVKNFIK